MGSQSVANGWSLEVVRGKDAGKRYPLGGGVTVLGNALGGASGIDLADQEGTAPRKMASRQASIESRGGSIVLRDLDSPGGTFVNRQRVVSGQSRPLSPGDLIQLGGVQLKLVQAATKAPAAVAPRAEPPPAPVPGSNNAPAPPPPPATGRTGAAGASPFVFNLNSGAVCRSWDDFLKVSAQRWSDLRDELTSGRLAAFLTNTGHAAARAPTPAAAGSADERLDAWLGRLPFSRPAKPELDVHPKTLVVRAKGGGGTTTSKVQITNTGYRLLRSSVRVEPPGIPWLKLGKSVDGQSIVTVEASDVPLEIQFPERVTKSLEATLVVESNGGTARVKVVLEPAAAVAEMQSTAPAAAATWSWDPLSAIARQSTVTRLVGWSLALAVLRLCVAVASRVASQFGVGRAGTAVNLAGPAIALAVVGAVMGARFAIARKEWRDVVVAAFAAGCAGVFVAALVVAGCQAIESVFEALQSSHAVLKIILWGVLGALAALLSLVIVPPVPKSTTPEVTG